jgi:hypothetical protein
MCTSNTFPNLLIENLNDDDNKDSNRVDNVDNNDKESNFLSQLLLK